MSYLKQLILPGGKSYDIPEAVASKFQYEEIKSKLCTTEGKNYYGLNLCTLTTDTSNFIGGYGILILTV
jgi:hypothetical protein